MGALVVGDTGDMVDILVGVTVGFWEGADVAGLLVGTGVKSIFVGATVGFWEGADIAGLLVGTGVDSIFVGATVGFWEGADVVGLLLGTGVDDDGGHVGKMVITRLDVVLPKVVVYLTAPC